MSFKNEQIKYITKKFFTCAWRSKLNLTAYTTFFCLSLLFYLLEMYKRIAFANLMIHDYTTIQMFGVSVI